VDTIFANIMLAPAITVSARQRTCRCSATLRCCSPQRQC